MSLCNYGVDLAEACTHEIASPQFFCFFEAIRAALRDAQEARARRKEAAGEGRGARGFAGALMQATAALSLAVRPQGGAA